MRHTAVSHPRGGGTVTVLDRDTSVLYTLPAAAVAHLPAEAGTQRPVLCNKFDPKRPRQSCRAMRECKHAHVDVRRAIAATAIHINYAYATPADCRYGDRLAPGGLVAVTEPASSHLAGAVVDSVPSECVLRTSAKFAADGALPTARCAHFYYNRECHRGAACEFAHVIHLCPRAVGFTRAPPPQSFGRGRDAVAADASRYAADQLALARGGAVSADGPVAAAPDTQRHVTPHPRPVSALAALFSPDGARNTIDASSPLVAVCNKPLSPGPRNRDDCSSTTSSTRTERATFDVPMLEPSTAFAVVAKAKVHFADIATHRIH